VLLTATMLVGATQAYASPASPTASAAGADPAQSAASAGGAGSARSAASAGIEGGSAQAGVDGRWSQPGASAVKVETLPAYTLYYPATLAGRRPVVVWGNGTFAVPVIYSGLLRHLASHGFIVAAANTPFSGTGLEMRAGIDLLAGLDSDPGSEFYRHVDLEHVGAAGHSQGGMGAVNAGVDPRIDTTVPIEPGPLAAPGQLNGPVLFLSGTSDVIVPAPLVVAMWHQATQVPAVYGSLRAATHFEPTGDGGGFRGVITAWFAYQLTGDPAAAAEFTGPTCGLCTDGAWTDVRRNANAS
jgi:pimeloyl-ACP methyl ester carboxylesterase